MLALLTPTNTTDCCRWVRFLGGIISGEGFPSGGPDGGASGDLWLRLQDSALSTLQPLLGLDPDWPPPPAACVRSTFGLVPEGPLARAGWVAACCEKGWVWRAESCQMDPELRAVVLSSIAVCLGRCVWFVAYGPLTASHPVC